MRHRQSALLRRSKIVKQVRPGISCNKNTGGIVVGKPLIVVGSVTFAIKGRDLLARSGIRSSVERTPRSSGFEGCGYSIYVPDRTDEAERILIRNGIRISGRAERGDG